MQRENWEGFWNLESNAARDNSSQLSHCQSKWEPSDGNLLHAKKARQALIINKDAKVNTGVITKLNYWSSFNNSHILIIIEANYFS